MTVDTRVHRPADYYSTASPPRVLPEWASYGCGAAAMLVLILVFAGGAWLAHGGFTELMDLVFGMTMGEMRGMYTKDVTAAQKKSLDDEIETMRRNLRDEKISVQTLQPVLKSIQKATNDKKVDAREAAEIDAAAKKVNAGAKKVNAGAKKQALRELAFDPIATFSILGYDAKTGEVGGAVPSRVFAVGNINPARARARLLRDTPIRIDGPARDERSRPIRSTHSRRRSGARGR